MTDFLQWHNTRPLLKLVNIRLTRPFKAPVPKKKLIVNDVICDNFLQQSLLHPENFAVIATLNLNGDYLSDALAAQVGG